MGGAKKLLARVLGEAFFEDREMGRRETVAFDGHPVLEFARQAGERFVDLLAREQKAPEQRACLVRREARGALCGVEHALLRRAPSAELPGVPGEVADLPVVPRAQLARSQRAASCCAVLVVHLDHFKWTNDTWGHQAGDAFLREVGKRLRANIRLQDFVGRYGGEEFAIVLTEVDIVQAVSVADKLCSAIAAQPCLWTQNDIVESIPVTGSFGVAVYKLHGNNREELIARADSGMYLAKRAGRNCVRVGDVEVIVIDEPSASRELPADVAMPVQVIRAITAMARAHDRSTGEHAHRLVKLAEATARKSGHPEEQMHIVRLSALLHDIGKVGISDAILRKPGKLSDEEWVEMRKHPEIGRQILDRVGGAFSHISSIIAAHHECWDGSGYPDGLRGETIPLTARVLQIADVYDALTTQRPYRAALPPLELTLNALVAPKRTAPGCIERQSLAV